MKVRPFDRTLIWCSRLIQAGSSATFLWYDPPVRRTDTNEEGLVNKKSYEKPAVVHTEKLEARAINCAKENDANCGSAPVQS